MVFQVENPEASKIEGSRVKPIDEKVRLGLAIYVWQDGKLVDIGPQEATRRG
jgi:hypothetical protein